MKILVTGAAGYLGREVVQKLGADGHQVTALTRSRVDDGVFASDGPQQVHGDITDLQAMVGAAARHDAVVHCAALVGKASESEFNRVNVEGTGIVAQAAASTGVGHMVLISSCGVYGGPDMGAPRTEASPLNAHTVYGRTKLKGEEAAQSQLTPTMKLTILRPTGFYGPGRDLYRIWLEHLRTKRILFDLAGSEIVHPCHVRDISSVISAALRHPPEDSVDIFNVAGQKPLSLSDLRDTLARLSGIHLRVFTIPPPAAVPIMRLVALARRWPEDTRAFALSRARGNAPGAVYDTAKVERVLKASWVNLDQGLREMAESFSG